MSTVKSGSDRRTPNPPDVMTVTRRSHRDSYVPSQSWFGKLGHLVDEYELTMLATPALLRRVNESGHEPTRIRDIYIPDGDGLPRLKIRWLANGSQPGKGRVQPLMVFKQPASSEEPGHWLKITTPLRWPEFRVFRDRLQHSGDGKVVIKDRYKLQIDDHLAHVYVYQGDLAGLVTVSFRWLSAKEYADLRDEAPADCLPVDGQGFMLDGFALAGHRYRDLAKALATYGYNKLDVAKFGLRRK